MLTPIYKFFIWSDWFFRETTITSKKIHRQLIWKWRAQLTPKIKRVWLVLLGGVAISDVFKRVRRFNVVQLVKSLDQRLTHVQGKYTSLKRKLYLIIWVFQASGLHRHYVYYQCEFLRELQPKELSAFALLLLFFFFNVSHDEEWKLNYWKIGKKKKNAARRTSSKIWK